MNNFIKKYKFEVIIFAIAFVIRLSLFFINFESNNGDLVKTIKADDGYYELSQNIINGHGFSFDDKYPYRPNSLRPPLWPYLIALFASFGGYWLVLFVELIMASLIPVFGFKIAEIFIKRDKAKLVGYLMLIEPYSVLLSFLLYSESSFTFFFIISLYFLSIYSKNAKLIYFIWSAIFLGLSCLIKPTIQYFPILIPLFFIVAFWYGNKKIRIIHGLIYALTFLAIISPWLYRNYHYFGKLDMTVQPAFNLYVYLVPTVLSIDNHTNFAIELDNFVYKKGVNVFDISLANGDKYKKEAVPIILDHKFALVKSIIITIVTFFTHDGMLTVLQYSGIKIANIANTPFINLIWHPILLAKTVFHYMFSPAIFIIIGRIVWYIMAFLMFYGFYKYFRNEQNKRTAILFFLIIMYFALTTSINGLGVNARFRIPILVLYFSFAVYGFYAILPFISKITKRHEKDIDHHSGI